MESEEITKLVDGVYKNILEKFNPGARQLITAGKVYLKALHGAAQASRQFNEALAKIAINAQQSGTNDIGAALLNVVNVNKEIQEQQMNILKAFYVDLLVPLETNLEKDTKVVQHEQKKFMQQHKVRMESYQKAVSTMKKQRKKKSSPENTEKELRSLQLLEDQKKKLDAFCEQSYKNAMTQERRRYGFVLERQCSIAKHWMAYHTTGKQVIDNNFENWQEIAASREIIPTMAYESSFIVSGNKRMERIKEADDVVGGGGVSSQLKKSRSVDAPYGDMRTLHEGNISYSQNSLPRAKSDFNLTTTTAMSGTGSAGAAAINSSIDHSEHGHWDQRPVVRALYAYMPSGENQLPFEEADRIALVGNKAKGWQFGENLRTQMFGWFPIAYTNADAGATAAAAAAAAAAAHAEFKQKQHERMERNERYENMHYERNGVGSSSAMRSYQDQYMADERHMMDIPNKTDTIYRRRNASAEESSPTRMFGDTINLRNQKKYRPTNVGNPRPGPPPTLPAPVPNGQNGRMLNTSQSFCAPNGQPSVVERRKHKLQNGPQITHQSSMNHLNQSSSSASTTKPNSGTAANATAAKTSLHSSNDSGFANEPPPQPEIDYSDEEQNARVPIRRRADTNTHSPREMASWTLNRNFRNSVDSQIDDKSLNRLNRQSGKMRYDLIASDDEILQASSGGIKRTKSFWKFGGGRSEDILAGMSLWQHRDLVAAPNFDELRDEKFHRSTSQLERAVERDPEPEHEHELEAEHEHEHEHEHITKTGTLTKSHNSSSSNEKRHKDSVTSMEMYDDDDNIYGMTPLQRDHVTTTSMMSTHNRNIITNAHANFTPKSRMKIMKTIEIDIESPTDVDNLSTLKRSQKQYHKDYHRGSTKENNNHNNNSNTITKSKMSNQRNVPSNEQIKKHLNGQQQQQKQQQKQQQQQQQQQKPNNTMPQAKTPTRAKSTQDMHMQHSTEDEHDDDSDDNGTLKMSDVNNFFDDLSHDHNGHAGLIMKTVKRKDILKQYYTSEDETDEGEIKSTSSDPYDCIVINDHLVRKDEKLRRHLHANSYHEHQMEFQTFRAATSTPSGNGGGGGQQLGTAKKMDKRNANAINGGTPSNMNVNEQDERYTANTLTRHSNSGSVGSNASATMNTPTATILPRTRLMKSTMTLERTQQRARREQQQQQQPQQQQQKQERDNDHSNGGIEKTKNSYGHKTYGPWYDFWDQQDQEQQHPTLASQRAANSSKFASQFATVKLRHTKTNDRSAPMIYRSINKERQ